MSGQPGQPGHPQPGGYPAAGQASYPQPGQPAGYQHPGYPQADYQNPGYQNPGYPQASYPQPGPQQPGYQNTGYQQAGYPDPGYQQGGYPNPGHQQAGYPDPGYQQGGYPRAAYPGGGAPGIAVTAKFFPMSFLFLLVKPNITVDGRPVPARWGRNVIPLPPGQHQVHAHTPYFLMPRLGSADIVVNVPPNQTLEMEYRPPVVMWSRGSLGPAPQKYNGLWLYWVLMAVLVLIIVCSCGDVLLNNTSS